MRNLVERSVGDEGRSDGARGREGDEREVGQSSPSGEGQQPAWTDLSYADNNRLNQLITININTLRAG